MISHLRGTVSSLSSSVAVLDIHGVGLAVSAPDRVIRALNVGEDTVLHTSLIVKEDDMSLTGFFSPEERDLFDLLRTVSGVGPKSALGVLQMYPADRIIQAIHTEQDAVFSKVSGIGPKTAKLIILSLHNKIKATGTEPSTYPVDSSRVEVDQSAMVQALIGLGWSERVAKKAVVDVVDSLTETSTPTMPDLLRRALQLLGPQSVRDGSP